MNNIHERGDTCMHGQAWTQARGIIISHPMQARFASHARHARVVSSAGLAANRWITAMCGCGDVMVATAKQLHVASICGCLCSGGSCVAGYHPTSPTDDRLSASLRGLGPGWVVIVGVVVGSVSEESRFGVFGRRAWQAASGFSWRPGSTNMWKASHFGRGEGAKACCLTQKHVWMTRVQTVSLHKVNHSFLGTPQSGETHTSGIALELSIGGFFLRDCTQVGRRQHGEGRKSGIAEKRSHWL